MVSRLKVLSAIFAAVAIFTFMVLPEALAQVPAAVHPTMPGHLMRHKANSNATDVSLFLPVVTYDTGGAEATSVAVADVNGDGKPDIVVANWCASSSNCSPYNWGNEGSVAVLLGNGDGTFQPAVAYDSGGASPISVVVADVNGDGKPDIIVANTCASATECKATGMGSVGVLLGNGDGTFQSAATFSSGGVIARALAVADLNGDGKPDIVVGHWYGSDGNCCISPALDVLLGNGDGTFQAPVSYGKGVQVGIALADLSGDHHLDIAVADTLNSVDILLGDGDGTFQKPMFYGSGVPDPNSIAIADLNGDGKLDIVVADYYRYVSASANIAVLLGNGDGTFQPAVTYGSGGTSPWSIAIADVNGDGNPDIVAANGGTEAVGVLLGNGDGTFQQAVAYSSGGESPQSVVAADLNGDGRPDLVVANTYGGFNLELNGSVGVLIKSTTSQTPTASALASSPNPSLYGQTVIFSATVTSSAGTPTGTVQILSGTTVVGTGTLVKGSVSIPVSTLPAGSDSVSATYLGGGGFAISKSAPLTQTVTAAATATSLASSLNPVATNQAVTFTATVTSQYAGAATGLVIFYSGSQALGTAALSGNTAALTIAFPTSGTYSITAKYLGDGNNTGSTSGSLNQVIITSTMTTLTSSPNPAVVGQAITFTAVVTSARGTPPNGESVTFYSGSAVLGVAGLSGGVATLTTSSLGVGIYTITATYAGDSTFAASTSAGVRQAVNSTSKSATLTALASSLNPSIYGQRVTFTATVTNSGGSVPTGKVSFTWGGIHTIGGATLDSNGVAIISMALLNADVYPLTAVYHGDANDLGSTSPIFNQVVTQTTSAATISSSLNPSGQGQAVTFTAKITSPTVIAKGPVTFTAGTIVLGTVELVSGKATLTTTSLAAGSTQVTVTYSGDSNIAKSSASITQVVQ